ncbi:putative DNA-directed RNA polymerase [Medicago truncatula]|uniref:DNA-directed RNA polymerase II n=1 Tax=Medicago truncatula TaxID=3880 RepID=A2Q2Z5_MEDTR|nr:DNA-directed RNA polymerase V subunit 5A [Medicago truncatula]ABN07995.1 RNA polymerase subunit, RPB5; RNA polymerase Rpb5, N-terminal [Medicago truncatula]AES81251.1 DNA-directed RNA polymerase II [Medicago truncatula]RHN47759.1 putative DNA-directed RNA polymerase [Medicago truncatula]
MATENGGGQNGTTETAITTMEIENGDITTQPQLQEQPQCLFTKKDNGSIESHRYYLSRRTVLEMLKDRGYSIPSDEIQLSLDDFRQIHGQSPDVDRLRLTATHATNPSKRILVVFSGPGIVKVNGVRDIAGQIVNRESLTGLILIVQNQITSQALKAVNLLSFKVEIFQITDLLVNATKHVLKPKHQVLTDKQKKNLLKKYDIQEKQLPRMLQTDAIARYYGLQRGQVVKVTYTGEITQMHVTYRCVW